MTDDSHLLAASEDRTWSIWDIANERLVQIFTAKMGAVRGVAMAPDQVSGISLFSHSETHENIVFPLDWGCQLWSTLAWTVAKAWR